MAATRGERTHAYIRRVLSDLLLLPGSNPLSFLRDMSQLCGGAAAAAGGRDAQWCGAMGGGAETARGCREVSVASERSALRDVVFVSCGGVVASASPHRGMRASGAVGRLQDGAVRRGNRDAHTNRKK